jgi:hypothetical protein
MPAPSQILNRNLNLNLKEEDPCRQVGPVRLPQGFPIYRMNQRHLESLVLCRGCNVLQHQTETRESRLTTHDSRLYDEARKWRPILGENAVRVSAAASPGGRDGEGDIAPTTAVRSRGTSHGMLNLGVGMQTSCREAAPGRAMESVGFGLVIL